MVDGNASYMETLTFEYPNGSNYFGHSVAISNGVLAVGSYDNEYNPDGSHTGHTDSGSVSLYNLSENSPARSTAFLKSPVPVSNGNFGYSIDLQGNQLVVGASKRIPKEPTILERPTSLKYPRMESPP